MSYLYLPKFFWFYCWLNDIPHRVENGHCVILSENEAQSLSMELFNVYGIGWERRVMEGTR